MENQDTIASNLVYQRKSKGLTQKDLSEKTNVTVRTIQRIEKGETKPHLHTIKLLAAALEIEVEDLIPLNKPKEENLQKKWLLLFHSTPLIGLVLPLLHIFIPFFLWIHKKDDNPLYEEHGRKVINFHLSMCLYLILMVIFSFLLGHFFPYPNNLASLILILIAFLVPFSILFILINTFKSVKNLSCYYPFSIAFFKQASSNS